MKKRRLILGKILTPYEEISEGHIIVEDGKIEKVGSGCKVKGFKNNEIIDARGKTVIPGLIDLHLHGGGGHDIMEMNAEAMENIAAAHAKNGTTGYLATIITAPLEKMAEIVTWLNKYKTNANGAEMLGIHVEGPYLNPKQKGAHDEEILRLPDLKEIEQLVNSGHGKIKVFTIAPELPGALEAISYIKSQGIVVSVGHSNATFIEMQAAIREGLSHASHLFNGMRGMHQREPGVVGAVINNKEVTAEIIADGIHVHPEMLRFLTTIKDKAQIILVTDATAAAGQGDGVYRLGNQRIKVSKGIARLEDGTMAGSTLTMIRAIENMVKIVGLEFKEALAMATINPARVINIDDRKGSLEAGKDADMVIINNYEVLLTMAGGNILYQKRQ